MRSSWTPSRVDRLSVLWREGRRASLIAVELGCSKNAVIGKAHRLDLPQRLPTPRPHVRRPRLPLSVFAPIIAPLIRREQSDAVTLLDLRPGQCRWPEGDRGFYTFPCDRRQEFGSSYCAEHLERTLNKPSQAVLDHAAKRRLARKNWLTRAHVLST